MNIITKAVSAVMLAVSLVMPLCAIAEDIDVYRKPTVVVESFRRVLDAPISAAEQLREYVINGAMESKRVETIDIETVDALKIQPHIHHVYWMDEGYEKFYHRILIEKLNPDYLVNGFITSLCTDTIDTVDGEKAYAATVTYVLDIINYHNGDTVCTRRFTHGKELFADNVGSTPEEAATREVKKSCGVVKDFFKEAFSLYGRIFEEDEMMGKANEGVYVSMGEMHDVHKKDRIEVCIEVDSVGQKQIKNIGEIMIEAVEGDDISLAKIMSGAEFLKEFIANGQTVIFREVLRKRRY